MRWNIDYTDCLSATIPQQDMSGMTRAQARGIS